MWWWEVVAMVTVVLGEFGLQMKSTEFYLYGCLFLMLPKLLISVANLLIFLQALGVFLVRYFMCCLTDYCL